MRATFETKVDSEKSCISMLQRMSGITSLVKSVILLDTVLRWFCPHRDLTDKRTFINWFVREDTQTEKLSQDYLTSKIELLLPILKKCNGVATFADENGQTIMHLCILHYMTECDSSRKLQHDALLIQNLRDMGASPIATDRNGDTPLGIALAKRRLDLVSVILRDYADYGFTDASETVLYILVDKYGYEKNCHDNYVEYVKIIKSRCIDATRPRDCERAYINISDNNGVSPVHLAAKHGYIELLAMFAKYEVNVPLTQTNTGDNTLIIACKNVTKKSNVDRLKVIKWLLSRGCRGDYKNNAGFTALHYASRSHDLSIIRTLVSVGSDEHAVAADGTNALFSAAMLSSFEVMHYLIQRGVEKKCRDSVYGFTLMHMAALNRDEKIFELLLENGSFELNDPGNCGVTPLHLAAMVGNAKVVQKMIDRGANANCRDKTWRCTPLHLASMGGKFLTVQHIHGERSEMEVDSSLIAYCFDFLETDSETDYKSIVVALLKAGAEVNARDNRGRTPLHYATRFGDDKIVEILLGADAHVDAQDRRGFTPLHNSLARGHGLTLLIASGADVNDIEHPYEDIPEKVKKSVNKTAWHMISRHLRKLKVAELPINDVYGIREDDFYDCDGPKELCCLCVCLKEVSKMKGCMLRDDVSLYDFLRMNFKRQLIYVNSIPPDLEKMFPEYYPVIHGSCRRAVNRQPLLESAKAAYEFLTGSHWPDLCVEHIFSFLSNKSLRAIVDSAPESSADCVNLEELNVNG